MTALVPLGLAIALNVGMLSGGTLWLRRQAKKIAAERATEYRGLFALAPLPPAGDEVQILIEEDDGKVSEVDAVHWPAIGWTDAMTLLKVEDDVLGWRRHPFRREPPPVDYNSWSDKKLAAETARRFGDGDDPGAR